MPRHAIMPPAPNANLAALAATIVSAVVVASACSPAPERVELTWLATIGTDTVQADRIHFAADRIEGTTVLRVGRTSRTDFVAELRDDGSLSRFEVASRLAGDTMAPARRMVAEFGPDSVRGTLAGQASVREFATRAAGQPIPFASLYGVYHYDEMLRRFLAADTPAMDLPGLYNGGLVSVRAERTGEREVRLDMGAGFGTVIVEAADDGHARRIDATGTTIKMAYERTGPLDIDSIAAAYAALDAAGRGLGTLSPAEELNADVTGARIRVAWSSPRTRGRRIFGGVVPFGEVWRTGANAATTLTTSNDLEIGGIVVPAGSYSLWTIPREERWTLILNSQTGQWGTQYDPARDFARLDMEVSDLDRTVDAFMIRVDPVGQGGVLRLQWDHTEARIPFRVR